MKEPSYSPVETAGFVLFFFVVMFMIGAALSVFYQDCWQCQVIVDSVQGELSAKPVLAVVATPAPADLKLVFPSDTLDWRYADGRYWCQTESGWVTCNPVEEPYERPR